MFCIEKANDAVSTIYTSTQHMQRVRISLVCAYLALFDRSYYA